MVKTVSKYAEESKVAIRSIRRDSIEKLKELKKSSEITEDELKKTAKRKMQDLTDKFCKEIDETSATKEKGNHGDIKAAATGLSLRGGGPRFAFSFMFPERGQGGRIACRFLKDRKRKRFPVQKLFPFCRGILGSLWTEMAAGQKEESSAPGRACLWGQGFPNDREALRKRGSAI